jgi:hypothetical protein
LSPNRKRRGWGKGQLPKKRQKKSAESWGSANNNNNNNKLLLKEREREAMAQHLTGLPLSLL